MARERSEVTKLTLIELQLLVELTTQNGMSLLHAGDMEAALGCRMLVAKLSMMAGEIRSDGS